MFLFLLFVGVSFCQERPDKRQMIAGTRVSSPFKDQEARPLFGGYNGQPLVVSNNPEKFFTTGYLLRMSQHTAGRGDIRHSLSGSFAIYIHHLSKVPSNIDLVIALHNTGSSPVWVSFNGALQMTKDPHGAWGQPPYGYGGPNAAAANGYFFKDPSRGYHQGTLSIRPGAVAILKRHRTSYGAEVDGRYEVNVSGGSVAVDVIAVDPNTSQAQFAGLPTAKGEMASTAPGAYGRASGVYTGARWVGSGVVKSSEVANAQPHPGSVAYLFAGTKAFRAQLQTPQAIKKYGDSQHVEGCYGVIFDLAFTLQNDEAAEKTFTVLITAPMHPEGNPPSFHWMGPLTMNGVQKTIRVNELGSALVIGSYTVAPGQIFNLKLAFPTPGDITAPMAIEIRVA